MLSESCPRCGFTHSPPFSECPKCGVVLKKFAVRSAAAERGSGESIEPGDEAIEPGVAEPLNRVALGVRAALLAVLAIWGFKLASASVQSNTAGESFLHLINLPFHEAGHLLFSPFGNLAASMGGSIGQLLAPAACLLALLRKGDPFGASVALWWLAENFLDMAPYINDARAGRLPLLGGNTGWTAPYGFHDWQFILNELGLLRYDSLIADLSHKLGSVLMLAALAWGALVLLRGVSSRNARFQS